MFISGVHVSLWFYSLSLSFFPIFIFLVYHVAFWRCARACPNVIKENNYDNKMINWGKGVAFLKKVSAVQFVFSTTCWFFFTLTSLVFSWMLCLNVICVYFRFHFIFLVCIRRTVTLFEDIFWPRSQSRIWHFFFLRITMFTTSPHHQ